MHFSQATLQQMHPESDIFAFALKHFPQNGAHDDSYDNMSVCVSNFILLTVSPTDTHQKLQGLRRKLKALNNCFPGKGNAYI